MTLIEFLGQQDPEQRVKLGAKDGNSFFYCGTVKDLIQRQGDYDEIIYNHWARAVSKIWKALENAYSDASASVSKVKYPFYRPEFEEALKKLARADGGKELLWLIKAEQKYDKYSDRKNTTKPLGDREVVDSFMADDVADEGILAIMVEGAENGQAWVYAEGKKEFNGNIKPALVLSNLEVK